MDERYIFKWVNDSINETFNPFWLKDTIHSFANHIEAEVPWYENLDLSTKIALISIRSFCLNIPIWIYHFGGYKT